MDTLPDDEPLWTQRQVMQYLGFRSRTSLYRHCKSGNFPKPLKLDGGGLRWPPSDVRSWVRALPRRSI